MWSVATVDDEAQWIVWPDAETAAEWMANELVVLEFVAGVRPVGPSIWDAEPPRDDRSIGASPVDARPVAHRVLAWTATRGLEPALALLESQVAAARRRLGGRTRHLGR